MIVGIHNICWNYHLTCLFRTKDKKSFLWDKALLQWSIWFVRRQSVNYPSARLRSWPLTSAGFRGEIQFWNWKTRWIFEMMSICLQIHDMMMISPPASKNRKKDNLLIWCFSLRTKQCNAMCSTHAYWQWRWRSMSA